MELDADLEAALPAFLASRREALGEMAGALGAGDRARFKRLAHKLAGSFNLYGFRWAAAAVPRAREGGVVGRRRAISRAASKRCARTSMW